MVLLDSTSILLYCRTHVGGLFVSPASALTFPPAHLVLRPLHVRLTPPLTPALFLQPLVRLSSPLSPILLLCLISSFGVQSVLLPLPPACACPPVLSHVAVAARVDPTPARSACYCIVLYGNRDDQRRRRRSRRRIDKSRQRRSKTTEFIVIVVLYRKRDTAEKTSEKKRRPERTKRQKNVSIGPACPPVPSCVASPTKSVPFRPALPVVVLQGKRDDRK